MEEARFFTWQRPNYSGKDRRQIHGPVLMMALSSINQYDITQHVYNPNYYIFKLITLTNFEQ